MPRFNSVSISGYHMHEAGATAVQELAFTLADGKEYAKYAIAAGLDVDAVAPRLSFFFGIGMNFFMEVAKLRAARTLWCSIMEEMGAQDERSKALRMHCQTSGVSLQEQDPHNNIVRTTIEALAGVLGGTQSLHTNSFDEALALPSDFSARIARNTQLILAEEAGLTDVADPLGGSYYVESLSAKLVEEAGRLIAEVDALGGMTEAVASGMPKRLIEQAAAARQARVDAGEQVIVGVNKYRSENQTPVETRVVDNHAVREGQIARIARARATRDEGACQVTLKALADAATKPPHSSKASDPAVEGRDERGVPLPPSAIREMTTNKAETNLLALAVECARQNATLGEISAAMEQAFGRYNARPEVVSGIYGRARQGDAHYGQVTEGVAAVARRLGRPPRIMVAKMGQDGHDRGAHVIAGAFADMGFDVISGPMFQTPEETSAMARAAGVDAIGVSTLAAGHRTLVPELIGLLKQAGREDIKIVVGGVIPPQDYDFLRDAGVQGIYGPGSNIVECAADILRLLGHNMPPIDGDEEGE